jgi:hypothetical protein
MLVLFQDHDQFLQTTLRWWEKVSTKPMLASNEIDVFGATTPSTFPTKKLTFQNNVDKKTDDKSAADDKSKRDTLPVFIVDPVSVL